MLREGHGYQADRRWWIGWEPDLRFTRHDVEADILSHGQPLLSDLQGMMPQLVSNLMASHYCQIYKA